MAKKPQKRGRKPAAKRTESTRKASPSETMQVISESAFKSLLSKIKGAEADKNEAVGSIGSAISNAVEKNHLDKKAFSLFRTLQRMSDNKLATTIAHFDHYREIGGLDERAANQEQMFERTEVSEIDPEDLAVPQTAAERKSFAQQYKDSHGGKSVSEVTQEHRGATPLRPVVTDEDGDPLSRH